MKKRYDADNGILFICKETNGWSNEDFQDGCLFRGWMEDISQNSLEGHGHIKRHPNMWYNLGRWAFFIKEPNTPLEEIENMRTSAIHAIGEIAFTNINKVRGKESSRKEYQQIARSAVAENVIKKEIEIIAPKIIVCCGTSHLITKLIPDYKGKLLCMPHTGARLKTPDMLADLRRQLDR